MSLQPFFFRLPGPIVAEVLVEWLEMKSVGMLDSACCGKTARTSFLSLCQQKEAAFLLNVDVGKNALLEWIILRRFYVVNCEYSLGTDIKLFEKFLGSAGENLRRIYVRGSDKNMPNTEEVCEIFRLIALGCARLYLMHFSACHLQPCIFF